MIENVSVVDVMSKNPITLHPKDSIDDAIATFKNFDIHHIPIVVMNKVVGILSLGDLLFLEGVKNRNADKHLSNMIVGVTAIDDVMTINPICLLKNSTLREVVETMIMDRINCLPITNANNEIEGLITTHDINKYLLKKLKTKTN